MGHGIPLDPQPAPDAIDRYGHNASCVGCDANPKGYPRTNRRWAWVLGDPETMEDP
jgi:hypothetical protein